VGANKRADDSVISRRTLGIGCRHHGAHGFVAGAASSDAGTPPQDRTARQSARRKRQRQRGQSAERSGGGQGRRRRYGGPRGISQPLRPAEPDARDPRVGASSAELQLSERPGPGLYARATSGLAQSECAERPGPSLCAGAVSGLSEPERSAPLTHQPRISLAGRLGQPGRPFCMTRAYKRLVFISLSRPMPRGPEKCRFSGLSPS
jgi:hypothetical protein